MVHCCCCFNVSVNGSSTYQEIKYFFVVLCLGDVIGDLATVSKDMETRHASVVCKMTGGREN